MKIKNALIQSLLLGFTAYSPVYAAVDWKSQCTRTAITKEWSEFRSELGDSLDYVAEKFSDETRGKLEALLGPNLDIPEVLDFNLLFKIFDITGSEYLEVYLASIIEYYEIDNPCTIPGSPIITPNPDENDDTPKITPVPTPVPELTPVPTPVPEITPVPTPNPEESDGYTNSSTESSTDNSTESSTESSTDSTTESSTERFTDNSTKTTETTETNGYTTSSAPVVNKCTNPATITYIRPRALPTFV
ncbi:hypothetical protein BX661DRAFT_171216 [Kickxella alabastrina]|uniref:uncharacterized protein n=1 Tax=Kickxella alabastrina TaxID=61397 RepID=UPI002220BAFD|nr:uncharacterized protein BX661DRAFT_171216 [Kickxella alabastrina]KAI7827272.1 hypothetical protein BX661DRAFT_171216 [Kickxella alabastrina]KAJ1946249.1 hypothetical protein GGF37_001278 [Kickxella alabastrina]